jgi:uncharacterized DUF497 family protein
MRYNALRMIVVRRLIWNEANIAHIARHAVTPVEVEEACHGNPVQLEGKKGRIVVLGRTRTGRLLAAILAPEPEAGVYYQVTARPASRQEQRYYDGQERGERT